MSQYEKEDVAIGRLGLWAFGLVVVIVLILWGLNAFFFAARERQVYEYVLQPVSADLRALKARENETLYSYKVLDAEKGIYQIPIDRAMKLLSEESFTRTLARK